MDRVAHFTVNTLALKRGGLVKAVRTRANLLADSGALGGVYIEVLAFQPRLEADVAQLKADGHLHPAVKVRSLLYSLDESKETVIRPKKHAWDDPSLVRLPINTSGRSFRYFRDGLLILAAKFSADGSQPEHVDYFDGQRQIVKREEMDGTGRVVRVVHFPTRADSVTVQRYIGRDGECFLTIWQTPGSKDWGRAFLFGTTPIAFANMSELYKHALERALGNEECAAICSEFRDNLDNLRSQNLDDVLRSVRHPNLRKIAMVHSNHLQPPYVRGAGISRNWRRLFENLDAFDSLVVLTNAQREDIAAEFGHREMIDVVPHVAHAPSQLDSPVDPNRVIVVARTHPKKRVDEAIRAFRRILDEKPDAVLEIFGFGYGTEDDAEIERLIEDLALRPHVSFVPFTNEAEEIYSRACVMLMTSASEGFGMVLLESMSFGVPVVAYDSNYGPRDVIVDGRNGYLVKFENHEELAQRALEIMGDMELRQRLGIEARRSVERFGREAFISNWTRVLAGPARTASRQDTCLKPEISGARWHDNVLVIQPTAGVPDSSRLIVKARGGQTPVEVPMTDRAWHVVLPRKGASVIYDFHVAYPEISAPKRLLFGTPVVVQRAPWKIYATAHGSFSVKDNRRKYGSLGNIVRTLRGRRS